MRLIAATMTLLWASLVAASEEARRLVPLARRAVEAEVRGIPPPATPGSSRARGVFVTIERGGRVIGCRGSLQPLERSLEAEVVRAARSAARHDPRYRPLHPRDLEGFLVTVTLVERLDPLDSVEGLRPEDGLVLKSGGKTGVVLPWEGKSPRVRLEWAYRKAGVSRGAPAALYRLVAERERG